MRDQFTKMNHVQKIMVLLGGMNVGYNIPEWKNVYIGIIEFVYGMNWERTNKLLAKGILKCL